MKSFKAFIHHYFHSYVFGKRKRKLIKNIFMGFLSLSKISLDCYIRYHWIEHISIGLPRKKAFIFFIEKLPPQYIPLASCAFYSKLVTCTFM